MVKRITSLKIDPILWKKFKLHCISKGVSMSINMERLIKKDLKGDK